MRKEFIRIALATTIMTTAFTVVPITKSADIRFTQTVEASVKKEDVELWLSTDVDTLIMDLKNEKSTLRILQKHAFDELPAEGYISVNGDVLKSGSNITSLITYCNSLQKYNNRSYFTWTIGQNDVMKYDELHDSVITPNSSTNYTFIAPITGEFRVRLNVDSNSGVRIKDANNVYYSRCMQSMSCYNTSSQIRNGIITGEDAEWYTINVKKGKKYILELYSLGTTQEAIMDMLFISEMTTGKQYKENKWYLRTASHKLYPYIGEPFITGSGNYNYEKTKDIINELQLIKIPLDKKSKVTIYLRDLMSSYNGASVLYR